MKPVDFRKINEIDLIIYHHNWKPRVFLWGKDPNAAFLYKAPRLISALLHR
jgi:hypothetical protein